MDSQEPIKLKSISELSNIFKKESIWKLIWWDIEYWFIIKFWELKSKFKGDKNK